MRIRLLHLLAFVLTLLFPPSIGGQETRDTTRVTVIGVVIDRHTRQALPNALVQIAEVEVALLSDETGRFTLSDFLRGSYRMVVSKPGYVPSDGEFRIDRAGTFELLLTPIAHSNSADWSKVIGWVTDKSTDEPLESAIVAIPSLRLRRMTDRRGWFDLGEIPSGSYLLGVESLGYETLGDSIQVPKGQALVLRIPLATEPIELEGITVTAHSRFLETAGFFRRRGRGYNGRQWTQEEIEAEDPIFVSDLATQILGVRQGTTWGGRKVLYGGTSCRMRLFIDDVPMDIVELDNLEPRNFQAMEVFFGGASEMPVEYGPMRGICGVILIWLKH